MRYGGFRATPIRLTPKMRYTFNQFIIKKNWSKINRSPLQKAGLKVMYKMRGLIRKARKTKSGQRSQKPSPPNKPPRARTEKGGVFPFKLIYSVPLNAYSVVIGHKGFGKQQTPMEIHEFGKTATVKVVRRLRRRRRARSDAQRKAARKKFKAGLIKESTPSWEIVTKSIKYPRRPFAHPAMMKAKAQIPGLWRNSVSRATVRNT